MAKDISDDLPASVFSYYYENKTLINRAEMIGPIKLVVFRSDGVRDEWYFLEEQWVIVPEEEEDEQESCF